MKSDRDALTLARLDFLCDPHGRFGVSGPDLKPWLRGDSKQLECQAIAGAYNDVHCTKGPPRWFDRVQGHGCEVNRPRRTRFPSCAAHEVAP